MEKLLIRFLEIFTTEPQNYLCIMFFCGGVFCLLCTVLYMYLVTDSVACV